MTATGVVCGSCGTEVSATAGLALPTANVVTAL